MLLRKFVISFLERLWFLMLKNPQFSQVLPISCMYAVLAVPKSIAISESESTRGFVPRQERVLVIGKSLAVVENNGAMSMTCTELRTLAEEEFSICLLRFL